jgi:hypothetical protein
MDHRQLKERIRAVTNVPDLGGGLAVVPVELWVPGSAVLTLGGGDHGEEALALWQVSPQGAPTGAWLVPTAEAFTEKETARRLLTLIERRGIAMTAPHEVEQAVSQLTAAAAVDVASWWKGQLFSPVQAFREILGRRREIDEAVETARATRQNVTSLDWTRDLPHDADPDTIEDLRRLAAIQEGPGTEAGAAAITVARVLRWLVRVWTETEQVKSRRSYVRDALGDPEALPPSWLAAVKTANTTVLPL